MAQNTMKKTIFTVKGLVYNEQPFEMQELLDMLTTNPVELPPMLFACGDGTPKGQIGPCRGVLLTDIINTCDVITKEHNDTKKMYIVVSSEDGYRTVFSWQELFNTEVGEGVIIIFEREGHKLYEEHGTLDLFSAKDFLSGPRYVRALSTITLIKLD